MMRPKRGVNGVGIWLVLGLGLVGLLGLVPWAVNAQEQETFSLLFPFYLEDEGNFSGYLLINGSDDTAQITVEGFDNDGQLIDFPENPAQGTLDSQNQLAQLGRQFLGADSTVEQQGWIRVSSKTPELAGLFQFGNGLGGKWTRLDGAVALTEQSQVLFFTRVHEGPATFPSFGLAGRQDATTFLSIANPNDEPITLTLNLLNIVGLNIAQAKRVELPAFGRLFDTVSAIFEESFQVATAYVRVDVEGPGAVGFELIVVEDSILGLNASPGTDASTLYSAQLASGLTENGGIFTSLNLVNTTQELRAVAIRAINNEGVELASPFFVLPPGGSFQRPVHQIFPGIANPTSDRNPVFGSLTITVEGGAGVIGDVIFGDPGDNTFGTPETIDYAAALPLQDTLFTKAVFSVVANGSLDPDDPAQDLFTRLALFNPNDKKANITLRVLDSAGNLVGEASLSLGPGELLDELVENLVPESADQIGGSIPIESTQPLAGQEQFGNNGRDYLSAVPPTVQETEQPQQSRRVAPPRRRLR